jgi:membrane-bound lytic murein transglycosylase F
MWLSIKSKSIAFFQHSSFFLTLCLIGTFLYSCDISSDQLAKIKNSGKLIVLTTNTSTTYYFDRQENLVGPEYEMTQSFADSLGVDVEYKVYNSTNELLNGLRNKDGDIAAAGLTFTPERIAEFDYGPVYQEVSEYLVCHRQGKRIKEPADMHGTQVVVPASTSYIDTLKQYKNIEPIAENNTKTRQLIEKVSKKEIECTVSDSTIFDIERRYYPEITPSYTLKEGTRLTWFVNKNNSALTKAISEWFATYKSSGKYTQMMDRYYGFIDIFDYVDTHKLLRRIKDRLPKYKDMFIDAAKKNGLSPHMLAAQSYQESHWDPLAKSPTGVRGIMMLTQPVAKSLGVTSRLDAKQNIYAGAKYIAKMRKMFDDVDEPDKTWLALSAYNVGRGHFRDAQSLARKLGKDPDKWVDMKDVLPLLSEKKYYKDLRYGYARGSEPVRYVARIRNYNDLIHEYFK